MSRKRQQIEKIYDVRNKIKNVQYFVDIMLNRTLTMFEYNGLPDSLPERELELLLQINGYCILTKHNEELVALWGGFAPPMDVYYRPTKCIVNNPWAKINKEFTFNEDCVLMRNDPLNKGLLPIMKKYGTFLTESELTLMLAMINYRSIYNIVASTDNEKLSGEQYLKNIEMGNLGVLIEEDMSNGIKANPYASGSNGYISQLVELQQYIKGTFFNELGLDSNYNMKRERLSESEIGMNEDALRPLIDSMLEERKLALKKVNEMYGTNISVKFGSAWAQYNEELKEEEEYVEDRRESDPYRDNADFNE